MFSFLVVVALVRVLNKILFKILLVVQLLQYRLVKLSALTFSFSILASLKGSSFWSELELKVGGGFWDVYSFLRKVMYWNIAELYRSCLSMASLSMLWFLNQPSLMLWMSLERNFTIDEGINQVKEIQPCSVSLTL